jgi:hypothetical protein
MDLGSAEDSQKRPDPNSVIEPVERGEESDERVVVHTTTPGSNASDGSYGTGR